MRVCLAGQNQPSKLYNARDVHDSSSPRHLAQFHCMDREQRVLVGITYMGSAT